MEDITNVYLILFYLMTQSNIVTRLTAYRNINALLSEKLLKSNTETHCSICMYSIYTHYIIHAYAYKHKYKPTPHAYSYTHTLTRHGA